MDGGHVRGSILRKSNRSTRSLGSNDKCSSFATSTPVESYLVPKSSSPSDGSNAVVRIWPGSSNLQEIVILEL
eukprot:1252066-Amphidinium_carterae.1